MESSMRYGSSMYGSSRPLSRSSRGMSFSRRNAILLQDSGTPEEDCEELIATKSTHFTADELQRLLHAYRRATGGNRLQMGQFVEMVQTEMGWTNALLRRQLWKSFDVQGAGEIGFKDFAKGYSTLVRGTVPELVAFAWRMYHLSGDEDLLQPADLYIILKLAMSAQRETLSLKSGTSPSTSTTSPTSFPSPSRPSSPTLFTSSKPSKQPSESERAARAVVESALAGSRAPLTRSEFKRLVLRERRFVDCILPAFEWIPQDPVHRAAEAGESAEVEHLILREGLDVDGADASAWPTTPLHLAAQYGHAGVAALLVRLGARVRLLSAPMPIAMSALSIAVVNDRPTVAQLLLEAGVDPLAREGPSQSSPLHLACHSQACLSLLLAAMPSGVRAVDVRDGNGDTPIHQCGRIEEGWMGLEMMERAGKLGAEDVDVPNDKGQAPMHVAAENRAFRAVRKLLDLGADPNTVDYGGRTPLHVAASVSHNDSIVELLLTTLTSSTSTTSSVHLRDCDGRTPLLACIPTLSAKVLRLLIEKGADPRAAEAGTGVTPLHAAVNEQWVEGVKVLLSIEPKIKVEADARGYTPLDYARHPKVIESLRVHIAQLYPTWSPSHPVAFILGLVFYQGEWEVIDEGTSLAKHILRKPKVSRSLAAKRAANLCTTQEGLLTQLEEAGLIVSSEVVRMRAPLMLGGRMREYVLARVGAPLYRLQQEATRVRLQVRRADTDKYDAYHCSHDSDTSFEEFTPAERHVLALSILMSATRGMFGSEQAVQPPGFPPEQGSAGMRVEVYRRLGVIERVVALHQPAKRAAVAAVWKGNLAHHLANLQAHQSKALEAVMLYFGHRVAFYFGFMAFASSWLLSPSIAGAVAFGLEFIPEPYASVVRKRSPNATGNDTRYDHPMLLVLGLFIAVWAPLASHAWGKQEGALAVRWGVDDYVCEDPAPNPRSTAHLSLSFTNGTWTNVPRLSMADIRTQRRNMLLISLPVFVILLLCTAALLALQLYLRHLARNSHAVKQANMELAAIYGIMGLNGALIYLLDRLAGQIMRHTVDIENHPTLQGHDIALWPRALFLSAAINYHSLFYFAYCVRDIALVAQQLAGIVVVSAVFRVLDRYLLPYVSILRMQQSDKQAAKQEAMSNGDGEKQLLVLPRIKSNKVADVSALRPASPLRLLRATKTPPPLDERVAMEAGAVSRLPSFSASDDASSVSDMREETLGPSRGEVLAHEPCVALEQTHTFIMFGFVALFGAAFPLAALILFVQSYCEVRLGAWRFCEASHRPVARRCAGLGPSWRWCLHTLAAAGVLNHAFLIGVASRTVGGTFLINITMLQRVAVAFGAGSVILILFWVYSGLNRVQDPLWARMRRGEPLRYVRDAYRVGVAVRERRYRLLRMATSSPSSSSSASSAHDAAAIAEGIDPRAAHRYLLVVRYADSLPVDEKRRLLYDTTTTVPALIEQISLRVRCGLWGSVDNNNSNSNNREHATADAMLAALVPVTDVRDCYLLGKRLRECAWELYEQRGGGEDCNNNDDGNLANTVREYACIEMNCTMPQAERYLKLVRYINERGGNPWHHVRHLMHTYPQGLPEVLDVLSKDFSSSDPGEPPPHLLGQVVEPLNAAKAAYARADVVRNALREAWEADRRATLEELIWKVSEEMGVWPAQLSRYLLIKRYCDSLDDRKRKDVLLFARSGTLELAARVRGMQAAGEWKDYGEPELDARLQLPVNTAYDNIDADTGMNDRYAAAAEQSAREQQT